MKDDKKTRKAPAFQLYTDDFLAGTLEMSQAEVGQLIRLLCHQWNRGSIPVETEKQQRLAGGCVSVEVLAKFEECEDGFLRNKRLESVRTERGVFLQQQSHKGKLSAEKRRLAALAALAGQPNPQPDNQPDLNQSSTAVQPDGQPTPQPESNSPSPSPSPKEKKTADKPPRVRFQKPTVEELTAEAIKIGLPITEVDKFWNYYESNGWMVGKNRMQSWSATMKRWLSRIVEASGQVECKGAAKTEVDWRLSV